FTIAAAVLVGPAAATNTTEWTSYLSDTSHSSVGPATSITLSNAGILTKAWTFTAAPPTISGQPSRAFFSSPTVSGGRVFIGANTGAFYALDLNTGQVLWQRFLGFQPRITCPAMGLVSTAAVGSLSESGQ